MISTFSFSGGRVRQKRVCLCNAACLPPHKGGKAGQAKLTRWIHRNQRPCAGLDGERPMNEKEQLSNIMQRMETLLQDNRQAEWARLLGRARALSVMDCSAAKGEVLHYFGGAGS